MRLKQQIEYQKLKDKRQEICDKIDKYNDPFFTYGWAKQIEEIDKQISELEGVKNITYHS